MVENFYDLQGFTLLSKDDAGNSEWEFVIPTEYVNKNEVILVK